MSREDWLDCPDPDGDRIEAQERRDREAEKAPTVTYISADRRNEIAQMVLGGQMSVGSAAAHFEVRPNSVRAILHFETARLMRERNRPNWLRRLLLGDPDKLRRWLG